MAEQQQQPNIISFYLTRAHDKTKNERTKKQTKDYDSIFFFLPSWNKYF